MPKTYYRVWVHPTKSGDDYYYRFKTLREAVIWYNKNKGNPKFAEVERPMIAVGDKEKYITQKELGNYSQPHNTYLDSVRNLVG